METLKEMQERHRLEFEELRANCPHNKIWINDRVVGFRHSEISLVCELCGEPLVGVCINGKGGYVQYAKGFQKLGGERVTT